MRCQWRNPNQNGPRMWPSTGPTRSITGNWCQPAASSRSRGNCRTRRRRWRLGPQVCSRGLAAAPSPSVWSRRGALFYMLTKYAHLVLFPVHPTTSARYRETFCTAGAKDDPNDTGFLLDLLLRHRERLRQLQPDTVETRLLQFLVEERRRTVNERTRQSNRLTNCLKQYFPQILLWFDGVDTPLVGGSAGTLAQPGDTAVRASRHVA